MGESPPDADDRWWDGLRADSFFRTVYRRGDQSVEGWVEGRELSLAQRTTREAEGVLRILGPTASDLVLDCPCGYARHSAHFAERGLRVVGVDRNLDYLAHPVRQAGATEAGGILHFVGGDMRQIPLRDASVTIALNLVLSFGFFASDEDNLQVLREFRRVLVPRGRFLLHTDINPLRVAAGTYGDRGLRHLPGGGTLRVEEWYDACAHRLHGTWTLEEPDGARRSACYSLRVYGLDEFGSLLRAAGLRPTARLGGLDADQAEFRADSQEVVWVAEADS